MPSLEITDLDRAELARLIKEGNTSGCIDRNGARLTYVLTLDIFAL